MKSRNFLSQNISLYGNKMVLSSFLVCQLFLFGRILELSDLETVDSALHNSLKYVRDSNSEEIAGLTCSVTE